jgi:hypothetical protein
MATITTDTFLDSGVARTPGETWIMNGGILTIRTDTRWHSDSPALMTGSIHTTTISSTLGGGILIDSTAVRWMPFNNGSGNVPSIGTSITQSGVTSSYLLGVYADYTSSPIIPGDPMPITGYIKFREVDGAFVAGSLIGIGADATSSDRQGWIEIVQENSVNTIPRLGFYRTRGGWFELDQLTTGNPNDIIQIPTNGGGVDTHVAGVWIESGSGTNEYEFYPALLNTWFNSTNLSNDDRSKFVQSIGNGQVRIGFDGSNNAGYVPPAGCRIRIPSNIGRTTSTANRALNLIPQPVNSRPRFTTTSSGVIDFDFFINDWYHLFASPSSVKIKNTATFDIHSTSNEASPTELENYGTGVYIGTLIPLTLLNNSLGGNIKNCKFYRGNSATNGHSISITGCSNYTFSEIIEAGVITYARSTGSINFNQCRNIKQNGILITKTCTVNIVTSANFDFERVRYIDRIVGTTIVTQPKYVIVCTVSTDNVIVSNIDFGNYANVHPYSGILNCSNSTNITVRNAGTFLNPIGGSTNAPGVIYLDSGNNDSVKIQNIFLTETRTNLYTVVNTSKNQTFERLSGSNGLIRTQSLNTLGKGLRATGNAINLDLAVYGSHIFDMFTSDTEGRIWFVMNEPTLFNSDYISLTLLTSLGGFTSASTVTLPQIGDSITLESSYYILGHTSFDSISPVFTGTNGENFRYEYDIDNGSGFTNIYKNLMKIKLRTAGGSIGSNTITVSATDSPMPNIGDLILSPTSLGIPIGTTVTNVVGNIITVSNNFTANVTGLIYFINEIVNETINPTVGFKLKIRITTETIVSGSAIGIISLRTTSTPLGQQSALYPLDYVNFNIFNLRENSRVQIFDTTNNFEIYNQIVPGSTLSFSSPFINNFTARIRVMYVTDTTADKFIEFTEIVNINGFSRTISPEVDTVYTNNGVDGFSVTGILIDDDALLIEVEDGLFTWGQIYAFETAWLYSEEGIRDEGRFITALDSVNYILENFKIKNISSPSLPLLITGGWGRDSITNQSITLIDTSGGAIFSNPDLVIAVDTGSGLSPSEQVTLSKIDDLTENVSGVRFTTKALEVLDLYDDTVLINKVDTIDNNISTVINELNSIELLLESKASQESIYPLY